MRIDAIKEVPPRILTLLQTKSSGRAAETPAREIPARQSIPEGERNNELARYAGRLCAKGHGEVEVLELIQALNREKCSPPLPDDEVTQIVESIAKKEAGNRARQDFGGLPRENVGLAIPLSRCLADIEPERVRWLSPGRIPLGKLTALEGDPELGKSTFSLELAARVTRGEGLPGDPPFAPGAVILLTAEDGLGDTVRPRLEAAGADLDRVHVLEGWARPGGQTGEIIIGDPEHPESLAALETKIVETGALLVVVDVLNAFLSGGRDSYKDHDIRQALRPLAALAERAGCAIAVIRHLRKAASGKAIYAGAGSIGIGGAARAVLLVDRDPDDPDRRVLAVVKCNLGAHAPSLAFRIEGTESGASRIEWLGKSRHTAETLTEARAGEAGKRPRWKECAECLNGWLTPGPMDRKDVLKLGRAQGFSESTVERAARRIGVIQEAQGFGKDRRSIWSLPPFPSGKDEADGNGSHPPFPSNTPFPSVENLTEMKGVDGNGNEQASPGGVGQLL